MTADDVVFYRRPVDTYDAEGYFVARHVRPMTRWRLTSLGARIRHLTGPELTAARVRALSIRLALDAGSNADGSAARSAAVRSFNAHAVGQGPVRRTRGTSAELTVDRAGKGPGSSGS